MRIFVFLGLALVATQYAAATILPTGLSNGLTVSETLNIEDDSGRLNDANWFIFDAAASSNVDIVFGGSSINILYAEVYFGDVTGLDFGGQNMGDFLFHADPPLVTIDGAGGFFDTVADLSFVADQTGTFSLAVASIDNSGVGELFEVTATVISASVPEPTTLALMGLGLAGIGYKRRQLKETIGRR